MRGGNLMKFGENLRNLRKIKKLSQEQLAEKMHVSRQSVSKWETGICLPDVSLFQELCKILDISLNLSTITNLIFVIFVIYFMYSF